MAEPHISPDAIAEYGSKGAAQATDAAVANTTDYAFADALITAQAGEREAEALAITKGMTETAADDWRTTIKAFNSGPQGREEQGNHVLSLTLYSAWSTKGQHGKETLFAQTDGPAAVDPRIKSVDTTLDPDRRLRVHVLSSADVRLVHRGKPVQLRIDRDQTFWMVRTPAGWKMDGWTGGLEAGKYKPER